MTVSTPYTPPKSFLTRKQKGGEQEEDKATQSGQGLADQRTVQRL